MSGGSGDVDPEVLADFLDAYWSDRDAGRPRDLDRYLAMFANDREAVAREFERLETGRDAEDTESTTDGGRVGAQERIGRFRLVEVLGRGGQAVVWLAEDEKIGRKVALKVLRGVGPNAPGMVERFRREAALTAKIDHPGICPMLDVGFDGVPWIAMRYVPGLTLSEILREVQREGEGATTMAALVEPPAESERREASSESARRERTGSTRSDPRAVLAMIEKVARALHAAHETGVIHRDVKPSNIKITPEGDPVILDFGIAFLEGGDEATLTRTGDFVGTPAYMAPEQIAGDRGDRRADVYSLGVVLFECLTLRRPFEAPTREQLFHAILQEEAPSLRTQRSGLGIDIDVVVATALQKNPDHRYRSAEALADELRRILENKPIEARPVGALTRTWRWAQRNRNVASAVAVSFVLLVAALASTFLALRAEQSRAEGERERTAIESKRLAAVERANEALEREARLQKEKQDFLEQEAEVARRSRQLADPAILAELEAESEELWPQRERTIPAIDVWMARAQDLRDRLDRRQAELAALRERALPFEPEDEEAQERLRRELFPTEFGGLDAARRAVETWRRELEDPDLPPERRARLERNVRGTEENIAAGLAKPIFTDRVLWRFESAADQEVHDALDRLLRRRAELEALMQRMEIRRSNAGKIRAMTLEQRKDAWDACLADLNRRYPGLGLGPQEGLVPLGRDADSGLWEFWVLESGPMPSWKGDASTGRVVPEKRMGVVLVLLPGGWCRVGAQAMDETAPHHDPLARGDEGPVTRMELAPFFIGKYEVTQIQWAYVMNEVPARFSFESHLKDEFEIESVGERGVETLDTDENSPVEYVTWDEAMTYARRLGLVLPTEEQWEHAARGGTDTPWWTGATRDSLKGRVNLGDLAKDGTTAYDLADGYLIHAPCGSFPANPFGLHEILGNVSEWTRSTWGHYDMPPREGDGFRFVEPRRSSARFRVHRGGSFDDGEALCRSARRGRERPEHRSPGIGLRLARHVE